MRAWPLSQYHSFFCITSLTAAQLMLAAGLQGRHEVQVKEESGCSQQLGQPTPAQPSQPEQPTRSQRRRALNFSEPGPPAPDTAAEQPGFMHSRVPYGEVRLHSCPDLIALRKACCVCFTCMLDSPTDAHKTALGAGICGRSTAGKVICADHGPGATAALSPDARCIRADSSHQQHAAACARPFPASRYGFSSHNTPVETEQCR